MKYLPFITFSDGFIRIVQEALELIRVELVAPQGRSYVVPGEAKTGWNWGNTSPTNPEVEPGFAG